MKNRLPEISEKLIQVSDADVANYNELLDIRTRLVAIITSILRFNEDEYYLQNDMAIDEVTDEIDLFNICMSIERETGVHLSIGELKQKTLEAIIDMVIKRL